MSKSSGSGNGHKILAAGAAIVAGEMILSHFGGPGLIVGLFAGPAAWVGIENYEDVSGKSLALPARAPRAKKGVAEASDGKLSLGRRLVTGKSYREAQAATANAPDNIEQATDEPEETYIDEDELDAEALLELGRGDELSLHVNTIFSHRVAVLGMSGGGKSNLIADFVEELGQQDAPLILLDYKGEYRALCAAPYLLRPVYVTAANLTRQTATAFARRVIDERLQVVVNLPSYEDTEAALVMVGLVNGVARYQETLRTEYGADSLIPCTFILEEAHYWLPQDASQSTLRAKVKSDKGDEAGPTVLAYLQQAFFKLSKIGRYLGMGLIVATQRPADVDNRLISQAEWYFLLKAMLPADLARYRGVGLPNDAIAQRLNPKNGEAYVIGPDVEPGVYHIRRRLSPDESPTPGLANIRNARAASPGVDVQLTPVARPAEPGEWKNAERHDADVDADAEDMRAQTPGQPSNVTTFPQSRAEQPVEPNEPTSDERQPKFQLTDAEITAFLAAYRVCHSRDRALASIGRGSSNYRECANRILRAYGLREEA